MLLINNACPNRYSGYKDWLHHRAVAGDDTYPKDWIVAMTGLDEYKVRVPTAHDGHNGASFQQAKGDESGDDHDEDLVKGTDGTLKARENCWYCFKNGHLRKHYPKKKKDKARKRRKKDESGEGSAGEGTDLAQWGEEDDDYDDEYFDDDEELVASLHVMINPSGTCCTILRVKANGEDCLTILLDTGSTHHVFCNKLLLKGIRHTDKPLTMRTNAGDFHCHGKGVFPGVGPVWYNPDGIINVLSAGLLEMSDKHSISRGSKNGVIFYAVKNKSNGKVLKFNLVKGVFIHTAKTGRAIQK